MIPQIICWISLPEIGYIVGIAVILFLNWIGLLWYYYTFYMKEK